MENNLPRSPDEKLEAAFGQDRATLYCGTHGYTGAAKSLPTPGCKSCAQVQLMMMFCNNKNPDRKAALDELEAVIHSLCELDAEGQFDYKPIKPEFKLTNE